MAKTNKRLFPLITFSLILIFNPSLNIVDLTPDFIAYFILASLISPSAEALPYFKEMKDAFRRLALLNIAKLGGAMVMFANLSSGSDIIPLFTLIFNALEVILLIGAINNTASAMFYLGERTSATSLIRPFVGIFGIKMRPETLKGFTLIFCVARGALAFLPEICLLTYTDAKTKHFFQSIYPTAVLSCFGIMLAVSVIWLVCVILYLMTVKRENAISGAIGSIIDNGRLEEIRLKREVNKKCGALTALFVSSFFTIDIILAETGDVSLLPPFIYGFFLIYVAGTLFSKRWNRNAAIATSSAYIATSLVSYIVKILFHSKFDYLDLYLRDGEDVIEAIANNSATQAYIPVAILSVLETLALIAALALTAIGFVDFIRRDTALSPDDPMYSRQDAGYHSSMIAKGIAIFVITALIGSAKCINVFLRANVKLIFSETANVIESSPLPWFHYVYLVLSVALIFLSYFFLNELKGDVRMKYSGKRISPELEDENRKNEIYHA